VQHLLLILHMLINICCHTCWELHPHTKSTYVGAGVHMSVYA
jgi:hypothetical protein